MRLKYKDVCSFRNAQIDFPKGNLIAIVGETNAGKSAIFYSFLDGFTNSPNFKKYINVDALKENPKAFARIELTDEEYDNWFQVESGINYLYYRANDAKYEKVGRKNIFELTEGTIPGLLYDPEDTRQIMNIQGEDDGFFPIDRTDSQIFKTYERLLSLSNTSDVLNTIKLDIEDLDIKITDALKTVQQNTEKCSKIDETLSKCDLVKLTEAIEVMTRLNSFYDELIKDYESIKMASAYVSMIDTKPAMLELSFDAKSFSEALNDLIKAMSVSKYVELCKRQFSNETFDVATASALSNDVLLATFTIESIKRLDYDIADDLAALDEVSNILDSIKVCPLCGKPMGECND